MSANLAALLSAIGSQDLWAVEEKNMANIGYMTNPSGHKILLEGKSQPSNPFEIDVELGNL